MNTSQSKKPQSKPYFWRTIVGVQVLAITAAFGAWAVFGGYSPETVPSVTVAQADLATKSTLEQGSIGHKLITVSGPREAAPALFKDLPPDFWVELDEALSDEIDTAKNDVDSYFQSKEPAVEAMMDDLTGVVGKYRAVTYTKNEWQALVADKFAEHLYSSEDLRAHVSLISSRMSRRMQAIVTEAAEVALGQIEDAAPVYGATLSVDSISAELMDNLTVDTQEYVLTDLKVNIAADVIGLAVDVLATAATLALTGAVMGSAVGPIGTVVCGIVGFMVGLAVYLAIEMNAPGTFNEELVTASIKEQMKKDKAACQDYIDKAGTDLKRKYKGWMRKAAQKVVKNHI